MARRYLTEILEEINADPKNKLEEYKDNNAAKLIFKYAFDTRYKFVLPEGTPPYKQEKSPMGLSPVNIISQLKKLYIFTRRDMKDVQREMMFISLLEKIHPREAEVLLAIKDQNLQSIYPNISFEKVKKAGFLEEGAKKPMAKKKTKKKATKKKASKKKTTRNTNVNTKNDKAKVEDENTDSRNSAPALQQPGSDS